MKRDLFFFALFFLMHVSCAMQQVKIHHSRDNTPEIIIIELPTIPEEPSVEQEQVRYTHKKKLALIGLATALAAGGTAVVVYLTK